VADGPDGGTRPDGDAVDPAEFRKLAETVERAEGQIESLLNRTNTLARLLDILSKRIDRLEAER
jgi:hypothetical protein